MYKSYLTSSVRNMKKNKLHAFINVAGLSVGLAVAIVIGLWIKDELSWEKHFDNYEKTGWVIQNVTNNGAVDTWWSIPWPLAEELRKNYGDNFEYVVLMTAPDASLISYEDKKLSRTGIFAERDFPHLFTLNMISGSRKALSDPSSILVSSSTARAFFGDSDPLGKVMTLDGDKTVTIAGVYKDIPTQSELTDVQFVAAWDLLFAKSPWISTMRDPWRPNAFSLYIGLADNKTFAQASASIRDAKMKNISKELQKKKPELFIHPMSEWHLRSEFKNGVNVGGRITYVWLFGVIGIFVVIMACINFMNLSTARSEKRSKEVGIRKAIGSLRGQLLQQFFTESILTTFLSFVIALLLVQMTLLYFNTIANKTIALPWGDLSLWGVTIALCLFIGLLSGSYPALYLSSIKPGMALKGVFKAGKSAALPRKVMVVVQFTVSVVLIIGTVIVFKQIEFAKDRPVGYDTKGLVAIPHSQKMHDQIDVIKEELINANLITQIAEADAPTTELWGSSSAFDWDGKDPDLSVDFPNAAISHNYGKTIGWQIKEGRDFDRNLASDSSALIINQAAADYMGLKNAVGQIIRWYQQPYQVIGVVNDIIARSPYDPVKPTIYRLNDEGGNFLLVRLHPQITVKEGIARIEDALKKYSDGVPFAYRFVEDDYALKFSNEQRVGQLAGIFTALAIFISCLGIFGLSSFTAEQRTKEISIRKVHGASILQLWRMMLKDFLLLVVISCMIAVPIAYQLLSSWLASYTYHVDVTWTVFTLAGVCTLVITMVTISWHTVQAAKANPIRSLRSE